MRTPIETETFGDPTQQAIFMVSEWAMPKEVMHAFAQRLSQRFYVVLANLPGVSLDEQWINRSRIGPNYDIDALSEQLIDVAPKEAWWIGWSLGGMISVYVAARRSSCVRGLVTLSTCPNFVAKDSGSEGMPIAEFNDFFTLVKRNPIQGLEHFFMLQAKGASNEQSLTDQLTTFLPIKTLNLSALIGGLRLLKSLDIHREWSILDVPNLNVLGAKDALVSMQNIDQDLIRNPLQECIILPNCTHPLFLEEEEDCVRHIVSFIDSHNA